MSQGIPIFFMHNVNSDYLKYSLHQAPISNPSSDVYLIGDESNNMYPGINHMVIKDHFSEAAEFEKIYKHFSTNTRGFELFCFQRWFVLLEIMKVRNLDLVFFSDSDLMVYGDLNKVHANLGMENIAFCIPDRQTKFRWTASGHSSFWTQKGLEEFCVFTMEMYAGDGLQKLEAKWDWQQEHNLSGGVCDMTLLYLFYESYPDRVVNLLEERNGSAFDLSVNVSENLRSDEYKMKGKFKSFSWKGNQPYAHKTENDEAVAFNTIHFQERAKLLMHRFYRGSDLKYSKGVSEFKRFSLTTARKLKAKLSS